MSAPAARHSDPQPSAAEPHFSLLRLSAGKRLAGAAVVLTLLWLAVWWAL
jgi:hypothetical protein